MPFNIVKQDIVTMKVDAIVNAANTELVMGGGVCGAIFKAAGPDQLQAACQALAPIKTGEAVITPAFALDAQYIIHAVGPNYRQWTQAESERLLFNAYTNSLQLARENNCSSIAFPLISSGIYGYPLAEALEVASSAIQAFLTKHELQVYLVLFNQADFSLKTKVLRPVQDYLNTHWLREDSVYLGENIALDASRYHPKQALELLPDLIDNLASSFSEKLLELIDQKGLTDVEVYKRANIDRKLFSKIRNKPTYSPSKRTALALAIALELSLAETEDLLERAGYAMSRAVMFDVIIEYFIKSGQYDVFQINQVLFDYEQATLGS